MCCQVGSAHIKTTPARFRSLPLGSSDNAFQLTCFKCPPVCTARGPICSCGCFAQGSAIDVQSQTCKLCCLRDFQPVSACKQCAIGTISPTLGATQCSSCPGSCVVGSAIS